MITSSQTNGLRRAIPLVLLGLALLVAGVAAVGAHRAQTGHREAARAALRDYATFAAWNYQQAATAALHSLTRDAVFRTPPPALFSADPEPALARLYRDAAEAGSCGCAIAIAGDFSFLVPMDDADPARFHGTPPDSTTRAALAASARRVVGPEPAPGDHGHGPLRGHGILELDGPDGVYRLLAWARWVGQRDTVVYGVELDTAAVAQILAERFLTRDLLPESLTRERPNEELLAVSLTAPSGHPLYASEPGQDLSEGGHVVGDDGFTARASVLPEVAELLVIGGLPRSQVPWLLLLFTLAAALTALAVSYLRRENRLAEERTQFVASVSHELRTPLAQIRLFVETLRLGRVRTADQREWALETIDRETLRLTRLVENVLRFSRAERGLSLNPQPLAVHDEVEAVVESFRPLIRAGEARFQIDAPHGLIAEADRDALQQILLNFLDNAVKYGPRGQTVRIEAAPAGASVRMAVTDQGPGVAPREREAIWNAFRRGDGTADGVTTGSGIGLSVVRALVEAQHGRCWVESTEGTSSSGETGRGGARFVVELPRLRTARPEQLRETAPDDTQSRDATGAA